MKKLTILIIGILLSISLNAQWYQAYGVTNVNDLNEDQCNLALKKATKSIEVGQIMTFGGAAVFVVGILVYQSAIKDVLDSDDLDFDQELNKGTAGSLIAAGGGIICTIGVPLWISGNTQKKQIEIALVKFKDTSYVPSFGLKINF